MRNIIIVLFLALGILIPACVKNSSETDPSRRNMEDFEAAWNRINDVYPFFEFKGIDWEAIRGKYRPRVEGAEDGEFHAILHDLLAELKDGHVYLRTAKGKRTRPYDPPRQVKDQHAVSRAVVKSYFHKPLRATEERSAEYGILPENVGYIFLADFHEDDLADEFASIIEFMAPTGGLIVDIRQPRGGTIQNVEAVVSRFVTSTFEWPKLYFFGEPYPIDPIQPQKPTYSKEVVVLINGLTISAGESTSEILKQLLNVTVVGDTTAGGGGTASAHSAETMGNFRLPSGIEITIPTGCGRRYDGQHFEWLGVPPDIRVEQTEKDIQEGRDRQLERAIECLR